MAKPTPKNKITYPKSGVLRIVSGRTASGFDIWCDHVGYEFRALNKNTNPTSVQLMSYGACPVPFLENNTVAGTIMYDLDEMEPAGGGQSHFLTFTTADGETQINWEITSPLFNISFNDHEQDCLRYRRSPEELEALSRSDYR